MGSAAYDPRVIERFAEQLLAKAESVRVGSVVAGGVLGAACGAVPLTGLDWLWSVPSQLGVATMLTGALVGVLSGWVVGEGRAFRYRVQAQLAYFQLEIDRKVEASLAAALRAATAVEEIAEAQSEPLPPPVELRPPTRLPEAASELPPLSPPIAL